MKKLLRNASFRRESAIFAAVAAVISAVGFVIDPWAGITALAASAALYIVEVLFARRRYTLMAELADELDRMMHGQGSFDLDRFSEGELSILQSELSKLLVALRSQADALRADRGYLADSMADISHQLKTPLTSMNLAAAMLMEGEVTPERRTELARDLRRELTRLEWLVSALLKISRLDAGTVEMRVTEFTVSELVDRAASPLLIAMELREIGLMRDISDGVKITADMQWCAEAVGNILKNCVEHTPPGGRITVRARENAIYTELVISDTGPGIAPEDLPHIFERFYRGKSADAQSAGIGLALARTIILSSGGTVKAENGPEGGARFTVRFYKGTV